MPSKHFSKISNLLEHKVKIRLISVFGISVGCTLFFPIWTNMRIRLILCTLHRSFKEWFARDKWFWFFIWIAFIFPLYFAGHLIMGVNVRSIFNFSFFFPFKTFYVLLLALLFLIEILKLCSLCKYSSQKQSNNILNIYYLDYILEEVFW